MNPTSNYRMKEAQDCCSTFFNYGWDLPQETCQCQEEETAHSTSGCSYSALQTVWLVRMFVSGNVPWAQNENGTMDVYFEFLKSLARTERQVCR